MVKNHLTLSQFQADDQSIVPTRRIKGIMKRNNLRSNPKNVYLGVILLDLKKHNC